MMKLKLVDDWRNAKRWISMHALVWAAAIQGAWASVPDDMKSAIPGGVVTGVTIGLLVIGAVGRLVQQDSTTRGGDQGVADKPSSGG